MRTTEKGLVSGSGAALVNEVCTDCIKKVDEVFVKIQDDARPKTAVDTEKMAALYKAGWTVNRIAEELKVTPQKIYYLLKKEGIKE